MAVHGSHHSAASGLLLSSSCSAAQLASPQGCNHLPHRLLIAQACFDRPAPRETASRHMMNMIIHNTSGATTSKASAILPLDCSMSSYSAIHAWKEGTDKSKQDIKHCAVGQRMAALTCKTTFLSLSMAKPPKKYYIAIWRQHMYFIWMGLELLPAPIHDCQRQGF